MTDITNTNIKAKSGALSTDYRELKTEVMKLQKKGLPFMLTSVVIWTAITIVRTLPVDIMTKNLYTFYCTSFLMPGAVIFSLITGAKIFFKFQNPFNKLGLLNTMNQMLYLLIVMWSFSQKPEAMLMLFAMVFGAHLLPFAWLYESKTYFVTSIVTTLGAMIISIFAPEIYVGLFMIVCQIVMSVLLMIECRKLDRAQMSKDEL